MRPILPIVVPLLVVLTHALLPGAEAIAQSTADTVIVENDTVKLYRSEYDAELAKLPADIRPGFANNPRRVADLLARLIVQKTLAEQARAQKLPESPEYATRYRLEVERTLAQLRVASIEEAAAKEFEGRRAQYEARAREIYLADRVKYEVPESVSVTHILFDLNKHSKEEGQKLAAEVRALVAGGADMNKLAVERSEDPSAKNNSGRLEFVRTEMDPAFANAAFALANPGDLSAPVLSQFGWHVIRLDARRPARVRRFEEVRDTIVGEQRKRFVDERRDVVINAIRSDPAMKVNQQAFEALVIRVDPDLAKRLADEAIKAAPAGAAAPK